jgi:hypothetical protein
MNRSTVVTLLAALQLLALSSSAYAQTRVSGNDFRTREVRDETLLNKGRFSLFLSATGGWAYGLATPDGAIEGGSQNTIFSLPSIGAGYMLTDALQMRLSINGIFVYSEVGGIQTQGTYGFGGTIQALYHIAIVHGMALYLGVGAGGYYSSRSQLVPMSGGLTNTLSGYGFHGQLPLGLLVQPGSSLFLRGGIRLDMLAGSESPAVEGMGAIGGSTLNFFSNAELALGFRI